MSATLKTILVATVIVGLALVAAVWAYHLARAGGGTIVLPAGSTYLGPSQ